MTGASVDSHTPIYTIGHSNAPVDRIVALLREHTIAVLVDVRSVPASRHAPQFNRAPLARSLVDAGIAYLYRGDTLGGRPKDPRLYKNGIVPQGKADYLKLVDYAKVAAQPWYRQAITDLIALARAAHHHHVQRGEPTLMPSPAPDRAELVYPGNPRVSSPPPRADGSCSLRARRLLSGRQRDQR